MTQLSLSFTGAELVRKGLQDLSGEIPKIGRLQIYRTMQAIVKELKEYPPPPLGSTYVRTGNLGRGWTITSRSNGYTLRNPVSYTKYVHGNAYGLEQAWMHAGRWRLLRDEVEEEAAKLPDEIVKEIVLVARRNGL